MKILVLLILLASQIIYSSANAFTNAFTNRCEFIFLKDQKKELIHSLVQSLLSQEQPLTSALAIQIIDSGLENENKNAWREIVSTNEKRGNKPLVLNKVVHSQEELFVQLVDFMRKEVENSLKSSRSFYFLKVYLKGPGSEDSLAISLVNELQFLKNMLDNFDINHQHGRDVFSKSSQLKSYSGYFWGVLLSTFKHTQIQAYRSLSRSEPLFYEAQRQDPKELENFIKKRVKFETSLNWIFQHYRNIQVAVLTAVAALVALDAYNSTAYYEQFTVAQTEYKAQYKVQYKVRQVPTDLSPAEQEFYNRINQKLLTSKTSF